MAKKQLAPTGNAGMVARGKRPICLYVETRVYDLIRRAAEADGRRVSAFAGRILTQFMDAERNKNP